MTAFAQEMVRPAFPEAREFAVQTPEEAEALATRIAEYFPESEAVKLGLNELLLNGIEHGNLEIDFEEKGRLLDAGSWRQEIEKRLRLPRHRRRVVRLRVEPEENTTRIIIRDQGKGFDWRPYTQPDAASQASLRRHGRGIVLARMFCFRDMQYKDPGNEVHCLIGGPFGA